MSRLSPENYAQLCAQVLKRDGYKCRHCNLRQNLHVHHIQYRSHGGEDASWNLVTLCTQCHEAIHANNLIINWDDTSPTADDVLRFFPRNGWRPQ